MEQTNMHKYFLSYKFTGVNINELHKQIDPIVNIFNKTKNSKIFCNLYWDNFYVTNNFTAKQIMNHCFDNLKICDTYIAFVCDSFGGGMAIECGYAICAGLKIVACLPNNCETFTSLIGVSDHLIRYNSIQDLYKKLTIFIQQNDA